MAATLVTVGHDAPDRRAGPDLGAAAARAVLAIKFPGCCLRGGDRVVGARQDRGGQRERAGGVGRGQVFRLGFLHHRRQLGHDQIFRAAVHDGACNFDGNPAAGADFDDGAKFAVGGEHVLAGGQGGVQLVHGIPRYCLLKVRSFRRSTTAL